MDRPGSAAPNANRRKLIELNQMVDYQQIQNATAAAA